jgi:hypothetical protein
VISGDSGTLFTGDQKVKRDRRLIGFSLSHERFEISALMPGGR